MLKFKHILQSLPPHPHSKSLISHAVYVFKHDSIFRQKGKWYRIHQLLPSSNVPDSKPSLFNSGISTSCILESTVVASQSSTTEDGCVSFWPSRTNFRLGYGGGLHMRSPCICMLPTLRFTISRTFVSISSECTHAIFASVLVHSALWYYNKPRHAETCIVKEKWLCSSHATFSN